MKIILAFFVLLLLSCNGKQDSKLPAAGEIKRPAVNGIWIPQTVNWQDADFDTYYFLDDTIAVVISSVQKNLHDSIYFAIERGYNIKKGIVQLMSGGRLSIAGKIIYRFIKVSGPGVEDGFRDTVAVIKGRQSMMIDGVAYIRGDRYTWESKQRIQDIATKMVPDIEHHPDKFE